MKPKNRKIFLIIIMAFCGFLVVKQYLPTIQLPTQGRVDAKLRELKSLRSDLKVAQKTYENKQAQIQEMQAMAAPFWITSGPITKVDQEINSEFSKIVRQAHVSSVTGSQKVDLGREKQGSNLQEVTLSVDFRNISMHELTKFFQQLRKDRNSNKFRWEYCKLTPDNPRTPKAVNLSVRFKIYALNEGALAFLGLSDRTVSNDKPSGAPRTTGRNTPKKKP